MKKTAAHPQRGLDDGTVAEMDAVEIAHGDDGALGDRGRRGGVADNGKTSLHFRILVRILAAGT